MSQRLILEIPYGDRVIKTVIDLKNDVTGYQARSLGKHIKRLAETLVIVKIETSEEITEIK